MGSMQRTKQLLQQPQRGKPMKQTFLCMLRIRDLLMHTQRDWQFSVQVLSHKSPPPSPQFCSTFAMLGLLCMRRVASTVSKCTYASTCMAHGQTGLTDVTLSLSMGPGLADCIAARPHFAPKATSPQLSPFLLKYVVGYSGDNQWHTWTLLSLPIARDCPKLNCNGARFANAVCNTGPWLLNLEAAACSQSGPCTAQRMRMTVPTNTIAGADTRSLQFASDFNLREAVRGFAVRMAAGNEMAGSNQWPPAGGNLRDSMILTTCGKLSGGGFLRPHEGVELHIWARSGTELANETHMHCALRAVERALHENAQSLTNNSSNYPLPHLDLESILCDFVSQEQQLSNGHQSEVSHLSKYLVKVLHECMCHVTMFSDGVHWRAFFFDGRTRVAYCVDPYGNQGPVSFQSRQPQRVLIALRRRKEEGGGGNSLRSYSQQWPMRTDLSSCLGLCNNGQYQ